MGVAGEDSSASGFSSFPRSLSLWWTEETEYLLRRIERWAACSRGYNRLRSVRLSPGRMTMREDGWADAGRRPAERTRLGCCARLDYKSNANLDSGCLEAYSLDHSIYFKTIGEIRADQPGKPPRLDGNENRPPLDCGDFLSSDFDDDEDEELPPAGLDDEDDDVFDLDALAAAGFGEDSAEEVCAAGVVQLCRSALDEDAINNNVAAMGLQRQLLR